MKPYDNSEYPFERAALKRICDAFSDELANGDLSIFGNVDIVNPVNHRFSECDALIISPQFITIVELKHWSGELLLRDYEWIHNGFQVENPHKVTNRKCRILKGNFQREFGHIPKNSWPWIESCVILTHPRAKVQGIDLDPSSKQALTFVGEDSFISFLKARLKEKGRLSPEHFAQVQAFLQGTLNKPSHFRRQIPGFELLETVSENQRYSEYRAIPETPLASNSFKRLRVFGTLRAQPSEHEKQIRNLETLKRLGSHPNIEPVSPHYNSNHVLVEVSNWPTEGTLYDYLRHHGPLPFDESLRFCRQILSGLKIVHRESLVHRDLRPQNLLVHGKTLRIANFDLAYDPYAEHTVLETYELEKESPYMAPEVFGRAPVAKSDIYSFGVIAFEMLTGKPPFKFWNERVARAEATDARLARELRALPRDVRDLLIACLSLHAENRPDASDALEQLRNNGEALEPAIESLSNAILPPGNTFNTWEILGQIGVGASAQVYRASNGGDVVALKIYHHETDPDLIEQERTMLKRVVSPQAVRYLAMFQWSDKRTCLQLEHIEGDSLRTLIDRAKKPSYPDEFFSIADELLSALQSLHQVDGGEADIPPLLHNDLTPSNILISNGRPRLIDFGLASEPSIKRLRGVPRYSAPDLYSEDEFMCSISSDLYTLAVTLFEWLVGRHPFDGNMPGTSDLRLDLLPPNSQALSNWFSKALAPTEERRFANATKMRAALSNAVCSDQELFTQIEEINASMEQEEIELVVTLQHLTAITSFWHNAFNRGDRS